MVWLGFLPQREVGGVAFLRVDRDPRARERILEVAARELAVSVELGNIEVYSVVGLVAVALVAKRFYKVYHLRNIIGGFGDDLGHEDIQPLQILKEHRGIFGGYLLGRFVLFLGGGLHLILAVVRIRGEMSYVGYVHYRTRGVAVVFERAAQLVHKDVRPEIAYVRIVIDRRSARVHGNRRRRDGTQFFFFARERVIENYFVHEISVIVYSVLLLPLSDNSFSSRSTRSVSSQTSSSIGSGRA